MSKVKSQQLTRAGFEYQDLIGLGVLLDWYTRPDTYQWVTLERHDADGADVAGLDDIVAYCGDNKWLLIQSKFTSDSSRADLSLSLEWLLDKQSRLPKWANAVLRLLDDGAIVEARLSTNRIPNEGVRSILRDGFLRPDLMSSAVRRRFEAAVGGADRLTRFCERFLLDHSLRDLSDLEDHLRAEVQALGKDEIVWIRFVDEVRRSSMLRDHPRPDGRIKLHHLRFLLDSGKSRHIDQGFYVPEGYQPPDETFVNALRARSATDGVTVIWGSPGLGKSTFLSYFCETTEGADQPVVRHHYFLSREDATRGRWWFDTAAGSIVSQLSYWFPGLVNPSHMSPNDLRNALERSALAAHEQGKRLLVVIDGLDHVWREQFDDRPVLQLFDVLLPLPKGIHLVVGTQKIAEHHFPPKLLAAAPIATWLELPRMSLDAVLSWLARQEIGPNPEPRRAQVARALWNATEGHPLYLVYSYRQLFAVNGQVTEYDVERLPPCPDNDIRTYYRELWRGLTPEAEEILHLCASSEFHWPSENAIYECLGQQLPYVEGFNSVGHLLYKARSGIGPFHGSIYVWLQEQPEHAEAARRLLPKVKEWLGSAAPPYWRWGWRWLIDAKLGDVEPLIDGPSRSWVIDGWMKAYPLEHMSYVFDAAERYALTRGRYARLVELRAIRIRLDNGVEYQGQDFAGFVASALAITEDDYGIALMSDTIRGLKPEERLTVSRLSRNTRPLICQECFEEQRRYVNYVAKTGRALLDGDFHHSREVLVRLAALAPSLNSEKLLRFIDQFEDHGVSYARSFMVECLSSHLRSRCFEVRPADPKALAEDVLCELADGVVRAACLEGIALDLRDDSSWLQNSPLGRCWFVLRTGALHPSLLPVQTTGDADRLPHSFFHVHFLAALAVSLSAADDFSYWRPPMQGRHAQHVSAHLGAIDAIAAAFAERLKRRKGEVGPLALYEVVAAKIQRTGSGDYSERQIEAAFTRDLPAMAFDISLLAVARDLPVTVDLPQMEAVYRNDWWSWQLWSSRLMELGWIGLGVNEADCLLNRGATDSSDGDEYMSTLADRFVSLAQIAVHHDLANQATDLLRRAAPCYLGYGWRKDPKIFGVLDAIEYCHEHGLDVRSRLERIEPIILSILQFTDGDDTNHAPEAYLDLIKTCAPERLLPMYCHYLSLGDWGYAECAMEALLKVADLSDPSMEALARTVVSSGELLVLKERGQKEGVASVLYEEQSRLTGSDVVREAPFEGSHPRINVSFSPSDFPPERYDDLREALDKESSEAMNRQRSIDEGAFAREWFRYWRKTRAPEMLALADRWISDSAPGGYFENSCLGEAFEAALQLYGRDKAYRWLVAGHVRNHGWDRYYSHRAERIVRRAGEVYSDRLAAYISDTSLRDEFGGYSVTVGFELLVLFLFRAGQPELAAQVADAMLKELEQDVSPVTLTALRWHKAA